MKCFHKFYYSHLIWCNPNIINYCVYLHWTIITNIIIIKFRNRWFSKTFGKSTANFMCRCPNHLSVMSNNTQIIIGITISKIVLFQKPSFYCKKPEIKLCLNIKIPRMVNMFYFLINSIGYRYYKQN